MKLKYLLAITGIALATGCSKTSDYTPTSGASGSETFKAACAECHAEPFTSTDAAAVTKAIADGNMVMPKFPNIKGDELSSLVDYVLNNGNK